MARRAQRYTMSWRLSNTQQRCCALCPLQQTLYSKKLMCACFCDFDMVTDRFRKEKAQTAEKETSEPGNEQDRSVLHLTNVPLSHFLCRGQAASHSCVGTRQERFHILEIGDPIIVGVDTNIKYNHVLKIDVGPMRFSIQ